VTAGHAPFPSVRTYVAAVLGVVALTIYGSLVPFEYKGRSFDDAVRSFDWVLQYRWHIESRADGIANFLLGVPLGFCLLGAVRLDRPGRLPAVGWGLALWPLCIAFAAFVEFSQLWFPKRTCSAADILCQSAGSAVGMLGWLVAGQRLTDWVRGIWATDRFGGRTGRVLLAYLAVLVAIQVLPFDVMTSPADVYRRVKNGKEVTLKPFAEWDDFANSRTKQVEKVIAWLRLAGVFVPVGVLAAGLPGFWRTASGLPVVFGSAVMLGVAMEATQLPIHSRHASVTDVMIEAGAVLFGWGAGVAFRSRTGPAECMGFAIAWAGLLAAAGWYPFDFDLSVADRVSATNLIPFAAIETSQYLLLLNEVLEVVVLFAPLGAAAAGVIRAKSPWVGVIAAACVAAVIELGQVALVLRTPATTDVLLAAFGGWIGASVWIRLWKGSHA
jgi:VanZ family protein